MKTCLCVIAAIISTLACAEDPFALNVRKTEPLTAEQEQKTFHLPPGFEMQLVANENDIHKPINIAFDAHGRLWITSTVEYPFPVKPGTTGRDTIIILDQFGEDGKAGKITKFAEGLNVPIGLYPYMDGAIGYSVPYVYRFQDTAHNGQSDKRDILYGPYSYDKDTHGMTSSFRRGFDGWLYACHGYNNTTTLKGADGSSFTMNSGNTYRMKLDGSHVEQFTHGQVNPFGLTFDPLGNLFSADCETYPIYQLLRGGWYPSFGKPNDGLGFAPEMMHHKHGSSAIGGIVFYADDQFPAEFQNNVFVGNVVTSRINRDVLTEVGSTRIATEHPDFVRTDDPWFRPVDQTLGPDGAVYVADFYNRIIGHYEVPLTHPGRDRERGRIWRIVYRGADGKLQLHPVRDWTTASVDELIAGMTHPNLPVRMQCMNQLTDRIGTAAIEPLKKVIAESKNPFQKIHGIWVLHRLNSLDQGMLTVAAKDEDRGVRVHAMRILSEIPKLSTEQRDLAIAGMNDSDAVVQRCAADAFGIHPQVENVKPLLDLKYKVPAGDTHLLYAVRVALRDQFIPAGTFAKLPADLNERDSRAIADVAVAVPNAEAGTFLVKHIAKFNEGENTARYARHAARYLSAADMDGLAALAREKFAGDIDLQSELFKAVQEGAAQRGESLGEGVKAWAVELVGKILAPADSNAWTYASLDPNGTGRAWAIEKRRSSDGDSKSAFFSSLPNGEQFTGIVRSKVFELPASISFYTAGHNGQPPADPNPAKNFIRLREDGSNAILMESVPPRNDIAQKITWDLEKHKGKRGYIEVTDGDSASAYAWLAVGRFNPKIVDVPVQDTQERQLRALEMARSLKLPNLDTQLSALLRNGNVDLRAGAARALLAVNAAGSLPAIAAILNDTAEPMLLRDKCIQALAEVNSAESRAALAESLKTASDKLQPKLALALASSSEGAEALLQNVESGKASPRLLTERAIAERVSASKPANFEDRIAKATKGLPAIDQALQKLLDDRRAAYVPEKASAAEGAKVFQKICMACHSIDGQGARVGPQLDGIGARGLERLVEDVLDPNRNVDVGFRYSVLKLANGQIISGLQRREEGELLVFADSTGKEIQVAKKDIVDRKESKFSLMPDNFGEVIPVEDFYNLMAFLLSKRSAQK